MKSYNKVMEWFWLSMTILIVFVVTVMGFLEGFENWLLTYVLALLTASTYLLRRYMRRRIEKHQAFLSENKK